MDFSATAPPGITSISTAYSRGLSAARLAASTFLPVGSRCRPTNSMNSSPAAATANPAGAISNSPMPGMPRSISRPLTTRLVLVPISVQVPPRIAK